MSKEGIIYYNWDIERYDVSFGYGENLGGLNCGDTFDVYHFNIWMPTVIEFDSKNKIWYLSGDDLVGKPPDGMKVRIH